MPASVVSRPLQGEPPMIDLAVGYSESNTSPVLKLFLSRLDELPWSRTRSTEPDQGTGPHAAAGPCCSAFLSPVCAKAR